MKPKKSLTKTSEEKRKFLAQVLKNTGTKIYDELDNGQFPKFSVPSRSVSNIVYDKKLRQYILGTNVSVRSCINLSKLRSFTQLMCLAFFANRLVN